MRSRILTMAMLLGCAAAGLAAEPDRLRTPTPYDTEYPVIDYSGAATHNRVCTCSSNCCPVSSSSPGIPNSAT